MTEPTAEQPQVTATVSPAAPPRSRWDAIPHHLGRARTSTVVLSLLFLAIGALWLNIRPDPVATVPAGGGSVVEQPAAPTNPAHPGDPRADDRAGSDDGFRADDDLRGAHDDESRAHHAGGDHHPLHDDDRAARAVRAPSGAHQHASRLTLP